MWCVMSENVIILHSQTHTSQALECIMAKQNCDDIVGGLKGV